MCGIAGILRVSPPGAAPPPPEVVIPESWLDILDEFVKHRGPDGHGRFRDRAVRPDGSTVDVAFIHRRLSIIDLADGAQPMVSADGRTAVVFNGFIYNHRKLREELQGLGHRFTTDHSDTEVIIHAWRQWKDEAFFHLVGMIACAVWDRDAGIVRLFRSSPGEKPLYEAQSGGESIRAFASTAGALQRLGRLVPWDNTFDMVTPKVRWITFGYNWDYTPMEGIEQPPFGTTLNLGPSLYESDRGTKEGDRFSGGDIERAKSIAKLRGDALVGALDTLIKEAVEARVEADVPVGCLLSGGVDSSLVAYHAKRFGGKLTSVCVRMPFPDFDESGFAQAAADHIGSTHRTIDTAPNPADDLVRLIHSIGLPFGDSSLLPTYWACKAAKQEVGVALSGDGGDELFYGYERYRAANFIMSHAESLRMIPLFLLNRANPKGRGDKIARLVIAARQRSALSLGAIFQKPDLIKLIGEKAAEQVGWDYNLGADSLRRCELRTSLPADMLRKVDSASLLAHLEVRAPLLDQTLVFAAQELQSRELMPRGQRKGLLRQIARKYLPAEIVDRPKQGFAIPIGEWFRSDYGGMRRLLMDHLGTADPWPGFGFELNRVFVKQMLDEHLGMGMSGQVKRDHSQRLYLLLVLSIWAKWMRGS